MKRNLFIVISAACILVLVFVVVLLAKTAPVTEEKTVCTVEMRQSEGCTAIYQPVCGWFEESVQCIKYPCAQTYGNSCEACHNSKVKYTTEGICPE